MRWRDLGVQLPPEWRRLTTDPDSSRAGQRLVFARQEPLHSLQVTFTPNEAPEALATSEVAARYFDQRRRATRPDGTFSDLKTGARTVAGRDYQLFQARFTPSDGPPIVDYSDLVVFPSDYDARQRWYLVQFADSHSATAGPKSLEELDAFVAGLALQPVGAVLVSDDFSDPVNGALSDNESSEHFNVSVQAGELAIQKFAPDFEGLYAAYVPGTYADSAMAIDVHGVTGDYGPLAFFWCRRSVNGSYRFAVDPSDGTARLSRVRADGDLEPLADWTDAPAFNLGSGSNHIEMLCRGSLIELRINQAPVISVHDTTLGEGSMSFGVGSFSDAEVVSEFRFANFVLTQR